MKNKLIKIIAIIILHAFCITQLGLAAPSGRYNLRGCNGNIRVKAAGESSTAGAVANALGREPAAAAKAGGFDMEGVKARIEKRKRAKLEEQEQSPKDKPPAEPYRLTIFDSSETWFPLAIFGIPILTVIAFAAYYRIFDYMISITVDTACATGAASAANSNGRQGRGKVYTVGEAKAMLLKMGLGRNAVRSSFVVHFERERHSLGSLTIESKKLGLDKLLNKIAAGTGYVVYTRKGVGGRDIRFLTPTDSKIMVMHAQAADAAARGDGDYDDEDWASHIDEHVLPEGKIVVVNFARWEAPEVGRPRHDRRPKSERDRDRKTVRHTQRPVRTAIVSEQETGIEGPLIGRYPGGITTVGHFAAKVIYADNGEIAFEFFKVGVSVFGEEQAQRITEMLRNLHSAGSVFDVEIADVNKGGFLCKFVEKGEGMEQPRVCDQPLLFLPASHSPLSGVPWGLHRDTTARSWIGRRIKVVFIPESGAFETKYTAGGKMQVYPPVSFNIVQEREKPRFLAELQAEVNASKETGKLNVKRTGTVKTIIPFEKGGFGIFVELMPGIDAMCHSSEASWAAANNIQDITEAGLVAGTELDFVVLPDSTFEGEKPRIKISRKRCVPDPAQEFLEKVRMHDAPKREGLVTRITSKGMAIVKIDTDEGAFEGITLNTSSFPEIHQGSAVEIAIVRIEPDTKDRYGDPNAFHVILKIEGFVPDKNIKDMAERLLGDDWWDELSELVPFLEKASSSDLILFIRELLLEIPNDDMDIFQEIYERLVTIGNRISKQTNMTSEFLRLANQRGFGDANSAGDTVDIDNAAKDFENYPNQLLMIDEFCPQLRDLWCAAVLKAIKDNNGVLRESEDVEEKLLKGIPVSHSTIRTAVEYLILKQYIIHSVLPVTIFDVLGDSGCEDLKKFIDTLRSCREGKMKISDRFNLAKNGGPAALESKIRRIAIINEIKSTAGDSSIEGQINVSLLRSEIASYGLNIPCSAEDIRVEVDAMIEKDVLSIKDRLNTKEDYSGFVVADSAPVFEGFEDMLKNARGLIIEIRKIRLEDTVVGILTPSRQDILEGLARMAKNRKAELNAFEQRLCYVKSVIAAIKDISAPAIDDARLESASSFILGIKPYHFGLDGRIENGNGTDAEYAVFIDIERRAQNKDSGGSGVTLEQEISVLKSFEPVADYLLLYNSLFLISVKVASKKLSNIDPNIFDKAFKVKPSNADETLQQLREYAGETKGAEGTDIYSGFYGLWITLNKMIEDFESNAEEFSGYRYAVGNFTDGSLWISFEGEIPVEKECLPRTKHNTYTLAAAVGIKEVADEFNAAYEGSGFNEAVRDTEQNVGSIFYIDTISDSRYMLAQAFFAMRAGLPCVLLAENENIKTKLLEAAKVFSYMNEDMIAYELGNSPKAIQSAMRKLFEINSDINNFNYNTLNLSSSEGIALLNDWLKDNYPGQSKTFTQPSGVIQTGTRWQNYFADMGLTGFGTINEREKEAIGKALEFAQCALDAPPKEVVDIVALIHDVLQPMTSLYGWLAFLKTTLKDGADSAEIGEFNRVFGLMDDIVEMQKNRARPYYVCRKYGEWEKMINDGNALKEEIKQAYTAVCDYLNEKPDRLRKIANSTVFDDYQESFDHDFSDAALEFANSGLEMLDNYNIEDIEITEFLEKYFTAIGKDFSDKDIDIEIEIPQGKFFVRASYGGLRRILSNIITNIPRYVSADDGAKHFVKIRLKSVDGQILIEIEDNAGGIRKPEMLELALDPETKTQTKRIFIRGTSTEDTSMPLQRGNGLATARFFALKFGGDIDVSTKQGVGTTFTIKLQTVAAAGGIGYKKLQEAKEMLKASELERHSPEGNIICVISPEVALGNAEHAGIGLAIAVSDEEQKDIFFLATSDEEVKKLQSLGILRKHIIEADDLEDAFNAVWLSAGRLFTSRGLMDRRAETYVQLICVQAESIKIKPWQYGTSPDIRYKIINLNEIEKEVPGTLRSILKDNGLKININNDPTAAQKALKLAHEALWGV